MRRGLKAKEEIDLDESLWNKIKEKTGENYELHHNIHRKPF